MLSCSSLHLFPKSLFAIDAVFVVSTVLGVPEVYCTRDDTVPATKTYLEATNNATNLHVCQQDTKASFTKQATKNPHHDGRPRSLIIDHRSRRPLPLICDATQSYLWQVAAFWQRVWEVCFGQSKGRKGKNTVTLILLYRTEVVVKSQRLAFIPPILHPSAPSSSVR